jgi:hypothetical protein
MSDTLFGLVRGLTDGELLAGAQGLAQQERRLTAELVAHLAELDRRGVILREGYSCLFVYCRDALGFSEGEAYNRSAVAEAAREFPEIVGALLRDEVTLTAVRLVRPHLTRDNHAEVLRSICGKRKAEVEQIVAALAPKPDAPSVVRKLPPARQGTLAVPATTVSRVTPVVVTAPDRYRLQVTLDGEGVATLKKLKNLLRHAVPSGDEAEIVRRALAALLVETEKTKAAATPRPRTASASRGRHVPAAVKRAVWQRDGGRCAFVSPAGHRCTERGFLEYHHRHPYAMGGGATTDNVALRCRAHNDYEARIDYGRSGTTRPAAQA